jgi:kanamycin kinase
MQDDKLTGFVDLGSGGVGDRHYDVFWGIWTLEYNLKTDIYKDAFLDAYGRQDFAPDRLELCRLLAGFTE